MHARKYKEDYERVRKCIDGEIEPQRKSLSRSISMKNRVFLSRKNLVKPSLDGRVKESLLPLNVSDKYHGDRYPKERGYPVPK